MVKPQRMNNPGIPFDPLKYMKRLESVGFTREQAEAQAETFLEIVQEQLVSKQDLKEVEVQLTSHVKEVEVQLTNHVKEVEVQLTNHVKEVEVKLTHHIKEVEVQLTSRMKELELQIKELEAKTTQQIKELEAKTTLEIEVLRRDLKIWFGGMLIGLVVVLSGIMTLIVHLGGR
ncbi:MAG: DUF1640 domain-containing protein [Proteobacteria bacterium]|nr:DUF1640 domain-containing protein [Pseudomonadota bacterium]